MASFSKYKTKNGEFWLFKMYTDIDPLTGKRNQTTRRGFKTKKEAQRAAAQLEELIDDGQYNNNNLTFEQVYHEWWEVHTKTIKPSTIYKKETVFNKHILPRFGKLKVKEISRAYCQKMINEIAEKIESANYIKIETNLVFKYAAKEEYISRNPMEYVVVPKNEKHFLAEEEKRNFWQRDELKQFLSLAKQNMKEQNFVFFYTLIYTGMRKGELIALEWDDVDFERKAIRINKTVFINKGKEILQTTKKEASTRTLSIDEKTAALLKRWKVRQKEVFLSDGIRSKLKNVICRGDLRLWRLAYPNDTLNAFISKFELHPINVHGLRHTHASILFEAGATIKEVQARLGHKDINQTMNIYTHVSDHIAERTAKTFEEYMESN